MQGEQTGPSESAPSGRHFTSTGSGVVQANMGPATTMPFTEMNAKKGSQRGRGRYRRGRGRGDSSTALHDSDATGTSTNDSMVQNAATPRPRNTRSARSRRPRPLTDVPNHEVTLGGTALTHSQGNQRRPRIPLTVQGPVQDEAANQETTQSGQTIDGNGAGSRSGEKERKRRPRHKKAPRDASGPVSVSVQGNTDQEGDLTASLIDGLTKGDYECMICYDIVRARDAVWSCHICFAVFHLKCVSKWGRKSAQDALANPASSSSSSNQGGWRCPGCQTLNLNIPLEYKCFCTKSLNPPFSRYLVPHTCGQTCGRDRNCPHPCGMQCHPGPCRPCESLAPPVSCHCGKTSLVVRCSLLASVAFEPSCGEVCGKMLSCGNHTCEQPCHPGDCTPCPITVEQACHCGKSSRNVPCGTSTDPFSCETPCGISFGCGHHDCQRTCHNPENHPTLCPFDPSAVRHCPCGGATVASLTEGRGRESCTDAIPTCGKVCNKVLGCGHRCTVPCHTGECPPCSEIITAPCRCGKEMLQLACIDLPRDDQGEIQPPLCNRTCTAMRHCKRHKCKDRCCDIQFHVCTQTCDKTLKCGKHPCTYPCGHPGRCHDCIVGVSFDEVTCHCGRTTMYPPIPCGTPPPICTYPCTRDLPCGHVPLSEHPCHPDTDPCPPCVVFVERPCACGKKTMKNIPCSRQGAPSCGQSCDKTLDACGHVCLRFCHTGPCIDTTHKCASKCGRVRSVCGHTCAFPCHGTRFCAEDRPCKATTIQTCPCGLRTTTVTCGAWKESLGNTLELACDDACAVAERNRKLAEALEITPSIRPTITWPATLIHQANQNPTLVKSIEKTLETFLSDPTKRTHHFPPSKFNAFISSLVGFYNLTPTFLDTDRKAQSSILVRKTPTSWVPSILLSAASQSKPPTTTASTTTSTAHSNTTHRNTATPTNTPHSTSLTITSLPDGMDTNDIQILLDPLLDSTISTHIHWTTPTDVIVSFSTYPESIERNVRNKFVGNGWAKDVFVSEVKERGKPSGPVVPVPVPVPVPTGNSFGVLCDEEDRGMVERGPTPESWDNED